MRLLLIRHALTPHVGHKLSGWSSGVHLSDEGRAQAARLTERLHDIQIDAIYASPLDRAVETAQPIAKDHKLRVRQRQEIGEVKYGELEGKSLRTLAKGKLWAKLQTWPSDVRFPGGESLRETQARAVEAIERLRTEHPKQNVAVVSHGDWIRLSVAHYLGVHIDLYRRINVDPASVSAILFFELMPVVQVVNETGDLAMLGRRSK
ncbi:MAG TPA: MSMEG_4193 family putative phosphomutase [Actinomycetota bacterium]|nr:MSMEG_4193 family putative phosphomutase [Actinomycetota bacterium]